jgi:hypothetical protein
MRFPFSRDAEAPTINATSLLAGAFRLSLEKGRKRPDQRVR